MREQNKQLENCLLSIDKIAGVSIKGKRVLIYLEDDSDAIRNEVLSVLASLHFERKVTFEVTGPFEFL
jgi:hypothetical protein